MLPQQKIAFCNIDKNAGQTLENVSAVAVGHKFKQFQFAPVRTGFGKGYTGFTRTLLTDSAWRFAVVYRDPLERFVSAYRSKCLTRDGRHEREIHCLHVFQLTPAQLSMEAVLSKMLNESDPAIGDPHFESQSDHCDGSVGKHWQRYYRIPFAVVSEGVQQLFSGRVSAAAMERVRAAVLPSSRSTHSTKTIDSGNVTQSVRDMVRRFYKHDYELFGHLLGRAPRILAPDGQERASEAVHSRLKVET